MKRSAQPLGLATACIALSTLSLSAFAQDRSDRSDRQDRSEQRERRDAPMRAPALRLDERYRHNHYYPPSGHAVQAVPRGSVSIRFGSGRYWFDRGVWYRPVGPRFVVTLPPIGIVVPVLPNAFVTLSIGGAPYFYANGVYYARAPQQGFVVVAPPAGADGASPDPAPKRLPDPIIYPREGQSPSQTEADRQDCNRWATTQPSAMADAEVFQRATAACMDGRGYTVR